MTAANLASWLTAAISILSALLAALKAAQASGHADRAAAAHQAVTDALEAASKPSPGPPSAG